MKTYQPPNKHHFVPESYQKGFCNGNETLFLYKKRFNDIKERKPAQVLYQLGLHTIQHAEEKSVLIETWLSQMEDAFGQYIRKIHQISDDSHLLDSALKDTNFIKIAKIMLAIQYWRLPNRQLEVKTIGNQLLQLYDNATDEVKDILGRDRKFIRSIKKRVANTSARKIVQFLLLPLLSFDARSTGRNLTILKAEPGSAYLTSDNPVICDNVEAFLRLENVIFPLSKNLLLVSGSENEMMSTKEINQKIFQSANEYIISSTKEIIQNAKFN